MTQKSHLPIIQKLVDTVYDDPLITSVDRGHYVESMIALVLDKQWRATAVERSWAPWDFEREDDGARLEVKQSAALQTWLVYSDAPRERSASFDIALRKEVRSKGGDFAPDCPGRPADVYIFAWHPVMDHEVADHRCPEQWRFFVVPEQQLPNQKTISINRLRILAPEIGYDQLAAEIETWIARLGELKFQAEFRNGRYVKGSRFDNRQPGEKGIVSG